MLALRTPSEVPTSRLPHRLVFTQRYDVAPGAEEELLVTLTLTEAEEKTWLSLSVRFASQSEREENLGRA